MKTLFIVNPAAGHGRGSSLWDAASSRALAAHPGSVARRPSGPGDGTRLAREGLLEGFEAVVAVGGDGTVSEVADGFLGLPEPRPAGAALGTWPAGSGCDLARHLGIKPDVGSMLALLARPVVRRLDAGVVEFAGLPRGRERRHFLNVAALGLAGEVARKVHEGGKPWGGTLSYLLSSLACVAGAAARRIELTVDGESRAGRYHLIVLANTSTFGGGMKVAPQADAEDGRLDLVTVGDLPRWKLLLRFPRIYTGGYLGTKGVAHGLARKVSARSLETVYLNIDGEAVGTLPADFSVLPAAVPFLCPA